MMLIGGLYLPVTFAVWGGVYLLARGLYAFFYLQAPPLRARLVPIVVGTQAFMPLVAIGAMIALALNTPLSYSPTVHFGRNGLIDEDTLKQIAADKGL